jgi:homoserine O-acetyltransferase
MHDDIYDLGSIALQAGGTLDDARLTFATYGRLNAAGDNCIVLPTYFTGNRHSYDPMIGSGRVLDPDRWFIVVPDIFGGGHATSAGQVAGPFPFVSITDNVQAQQRLVFDALGVNSVALAAGWSMGAMQAYAWAVLEPDRVQALLPWCGAAACWPINAVFLDGLARCMESDPSIEKQAGRRLFARIYAGWAYSPPFFRQGLYRQLGTPDLSAFLTSWEKDHLEIAAHDLMAVLRTWASAVPGHLVPGLSHSDALARIRARTIVVANPQDRYFTAEENDLEVRCVPGGELRLLDSAAGHCAGAPGRFADDTEFIERAIRDLLGD